jgi:ubiquinone/menaquinone biosynthesis C-methylase UbiE
MTAIDKQWEQIHTSKSWGRYPSEDVIRFVARNYFKTRRSETNILDLGCGAGANTWFLAREGFNTFAFDGSFSAMQKCRNNLEEPADCSLFQADAASLPLQADKFDAVIDAAVISANSPRNVKTILQEIFRVLKPGGKLFSSSLFLCETTGFNSGKKLDELCYRNVSSGPLAGVGTIHFFTRELIEELYSQAGFVDLQLDLSKRTLNNEEIVVSCYMVVASKPGE